MQRHGDDQPILFSPAVSFVRNGRRRAAGSRLVVEKSNSKQGDEVGKLERSGVAWMDGRGMGDEMMHSWPSRLAIWRSWTAFLIGSHHPDWPCQPGGLSPPDPLACLLAPSTLATVPAGHWPTDLTRSQISTIPTTKMTTPRGRLQWVPDSH